MTSEARPQTQASGFKRWKKPLTIAFFVLLIVLFTLLARRIDWSEVFQTLSEFKLRTLFIAGALTLCSFIVYACFDLIGRTYIRQPLRWKQILPVGIISYAFNLNLSAWVGGIALMAVGHLTSFLLVERVYQAGRAQLLTIGFGELDDKFFQYIVIAFDQAITPALEAVETFVVLARRGIHLIEHRQNFVDRLIAHQLADELDVPLTGNMSRMF